jgi:hypothetical protein
MGEARARDGRRASETEEDPTDATAAGQGALTAVERFGGEDFGIGSSLEQWEESCRCSLGRPGKQEKDAGAST